jgi:hypothetical protein
MLAKERKKCLGLVETCSLVDVVREVEGRLKVFRRKLYSRQRYSRQRDSCRLDSDYLNRCCRDRVTQGLRDVCNATNHDSAIGTRNVCVEMRAIGGVPSLRLEVLLWWRNHDEVEVESLIVVLWTLIGWVDSIEK